MLIQTFAHSRETRGDTSNVASLRTLYSDITPHEVRKEKDGPLISGAVFDGPRGRRNASEVTLGLLDFDGLTAEQVHGLLTGLEGTEAFWYTTFSHSPPVHKIRVVVGLSRSVQPSEWAEWWPRFAHYVGLDIADPAPAKNIACVFFTPSCPEERVHHADHSFLEGDPLDVDALLELPFPQGYEKKESHESDAVSDVIPENFEAPNAVRSFAERRLVEATKKIEATPAGPIYPTLNSEAFAVGRYTPHILETQRVRDVLVSAALARNPDPNPPDKYHVIVSKAIEDGQQAPWVPEQRYPLHDVGNGKRFARLNGQRARWLRDAKAWTVWDGRRWVVDDVMVRAQAEIVADHIREEAQYEEDGDAVKALKAAAKALGSTSKITNMLKEAASNSSLHSMQDDFEPSAWLLNCANGVVDLRTGRLRAARPEDFLTRLCSTKYEPDARSAEWERFVLQIMGGDAEMVSYVRRSLGYSLTGSVREHCLFFCYGKGRNGKSTLLETSALAMGEYATIVAGDFLLSRKNTEHKTEIANLFRRRLIISPEAEEGRSWNEVRVKQMSGGDSLNARRMREDDWSFTPTHKLWVTGNHKPRVRGTDDGIWSRFRLIPFEQSFENSPDRELPERLRLHLPAILAWLVRGAREWYEDGLGEPVRVRQAIATYRKDEDILGPFLEECTVPDPEARVSRRAIQQAYEIWCGQNGDQALLRKQFFSQLRDRGFDDYASSGERGFAGLKLKAT